MDYSENSPTTSSVIHGQAILNKTLSEVWQPPTELRMWKWAEEHIIIPRRAGTPFPGRYRTSITPWVRGWFDAIQDPDVDTVVIEKGAQVSATQTCYCAMCYWVCEDPDPVLVVMPALDDAKESSRVRIQPLFEDSPRVSQELTDNPDDLTLSEYHLRNTTVRLVGANSPGKLAAFAHRYLILDEIDKYKETLGKEGSVIGLATQRAKYFWNRKVIAISTPTTIAGYIHRFYLRGDQRRFFCPCPHCGHYQVLVWAQVKFDSNLSPIKAGATAHYECKKCNGHINDNQKREMVMHGKWRGTAEAQQTGYVSFHISGLYSFADSCAFGALTEKFLTVKSNMADLQDFINSDLGELWEERSVEPFDRKRIIEIRDTNSYDRGRIPTDLPVIVASLIDVQASYIVWTVWALRAHDCWLVDHGTASVLEDCDSIAVGPYPDEADREYACHVQVFDSGYRTTEVYRHCARRPKAIVIKGDTGAQTKQTMPVRHQKIDRYPDGKPLPRGLILRHIHPTYFKEETLRALGPDKDDEGEPVARSVNVWFHNEVDAAFADQVTGEVPMEDKPDKFGNKRRYWKKIRPNHYFDLTQYMMALRWILRRDLSKLETKKKGMPEDIKKGKKPKPIPKAALPQGPLICRNCGSDKIRVLSRGKIHCCRQCGYVRDLEKEAGRRRDRKDSWADDDAADRGELF